MNLVAESGFQGKPIVGQRHTKSQTKIPDPEHLYDHTVNSDTCTPSHTHWPVNILAAMVFLIPAVGVPNEYILQDTLKSAIAALGILLAAFAWIWDLQKHPRPLRWHWILLLPIALCLYALGSMAWSHTYLAGVEAVRWFLLSLLMWVTLNTVSSKSSRRMLWGLHWGLFVASMWLALQFWADFHLFPQAAPPASTFINRNFFAEYAVSALPISWYLLASSPTSKWLPFLAVTVALNFIAILMTGTRSALIALLLSTSALFLIFFHHTRLFQFSKWSHRLRLTVGIALIGSVGVMGLIPSVNTELGFGQTAFGMSGTRSQTITTVIQGDDSSVSTRMDMWKATARMFLDQPWMGVGAGAWEVEIPRYQRIGTYLETDYYPHNEVLQILSEYGAVVGGIAIAFFLAYLLKAALEAPAQLQQAAPLQPLKSFAGLSLASLLIVSNAGFSLHLASTCVLFALMLALRELPTNEVKIPSIAVTARCYQLIASMAQMLTLGLTLAALYICIQSFRAEYHLASGVFMGNEALEKRATSPEASKNLHESMLSHSRLGIAINPHYRKITPILGPLLVGLNDWPHAIWIWESMAQSRPHVAAFWYNLTKGYLELGEVEMARNALQKLVALQPQAPGAIALDARILDRGGQHAQAIHLIQRHMDAGTFDYDVLDLALSFANSDHDWQLARKALGLQLATRPQQQAEINFKLGWLLFNHWPESQHAQALQYFQAGYAALPPLQRPNYLQGTPAPFRSLVVAPQ